MATDSFVGFIPNNKDGNSFLAACRKLLRNTGMVIRPYARNANRKQFYAHDKPAYGKHAYCCNLPLKHASYYALYLYKSKSDKGSYHDLLNNAKIVVDTVRKVYQINNLNLNTK